MPYRVVLRSCVDKTDSRFLTNKDVADLTVQRISPSIRDNLICIIFYPPKLL